jgi:hypothetical protein
MVTIQSICDAITNFMDKYRHPFPQLSRALLVCSVPKRPGLSTIYSVSNIVKDLNKLGIPTGPMPDGTPNLTVAFVYATTKEIYRAMKKDAAVQSGFQPGTVSFFGTGANAGGPVEIYGTNLTFGDGHGTIT